MNILINRSDAIGDTLLTIPMADIIKDHFPQAKIFFLVSPKCKDLFLHHPKVDGLVIFKEKTNFIDKFIYLKKKMEDLSIDHYFYVGGDHLPSIVAWIMGIEFRGGPLSKLSGFLFLNKGIRQKRSLVEMHEVEYNLKLLQPLGIQFQANLREKYFPKITIQPEEKEVAYRYLEEVFQEQKILLQKEYLIIHPGMSGHTLNWSSRNYARLIIRLEKLFPQRFSYIVSYTPSDNHYLLGLQDELKQVGNESILQKVCFFNGQKKGLRNYMGVLAGAKLFIGPSTGTTHLANALAVPLIGLYSPIKVQSAMRWGPYLGTQEKDCIRIVVPDVICGEIFQCAGQKCPYYECMSKVEVSKVVDLIIQYISKQDQDKTKI